MAKKYSKKEVIDFLRSISIMSVSINSDEYPVSSILLFYVDDNFIFYFATRNDTRKAIALEKDPKMGVSVWDHNRMLVQSKGDVEKLSSPGEIDDALDKLAKVVAEMKDFWPPILRLDGGEYNVYRFKPNWLRALDLTSSVIKEEDIPFTVFEL